MGKRPVMIVMGAAFAGLAAWTIHVQLDLNLARDRARALAHRLEIAREVVHIAEVSSRRDDERAAAELDRLRDRLRSARRDNRRLASDLEDVTCFEGTENAFVRGPLRGDFDADGVTDAVYTQARVGLDGDCEYFVVVTTADGTHSRRVGGDPDALSPALAPFLLADVNEVPGQEIMVEVDRGAYAQIVRLYTMAGGRLVPIRGFGGRDVWVEGSSTGNGSVFDCAGGRAGSVIAGEYHYTRDARGYTVRRSLYSLSGRSAVRVRVDEAEVPLSRLGRFPELRHDAAFVHCPGRKPAYVDPG